MSYKEYEINYSISEEALKKVLKSLNGKKSFKNYFLSNKKMYSGIITDDKIDAMAFDAPPMRVRGIINDEQVEIKHRI